MKRCLTVLAVLHLIAQLCFVIPNLLGRTDMDRDMVVYYNAAQAAVTHHNLYQACPEYRPEMSPSGYFYAPPFAAVIAPLGRLSWHGFCIAWYAIIFAAYWLFALALSRLSAGRFSMLVCGLFIALWPRSYYAIEVGQADPIMWALLAWAAASPRFRGMLLAVAVIVKPFMLLPLAVVAFRDRRQALPACAVMIVALALGALVCGPWSYAQWVREALPVPASGTFNSDNISLSFDLLRLVGYQAWAHTWLSFAALAGPLVAIVCTRRLSIELQYSVVTIAAMLCAPICWTSYLVVGLVPVMVLAGNKKAALSIEKEAQKANGIVVQTVRY